MTQFAFLQREWPAVFEAAGKAEAAVHADPRTACFYARRALELAVAWAYKYDAGAQTAVPGQPLGADPRAELQADRGRGGVQQGAGDRHARQPRRAQPSRDPDGRRAGGGARAVPCRVLARPHLRPRGAAGAGAGVRRKRIAEGYACAQARRRAAAAPRSRAARARREARDAAGRQVRARRRAEAAARRGGRGEEGCRGAAGHARLLRSRDSRLLHRPAAQGSRLAAGSGTGPRVRSQRHAQQGGQGLRRLRALGRRRQAARAGRSEAHPARCARRPAAGQALRRLPGAPVRPAADHLLLQRLRALAVGRHELPAARGAGLLQEGGAGAR